ncbi:MAG: hypothetical protein P9M07_02070 [Candidatus Aceula meridiana]|nr:hypothetical protein [Candidatus Aceula meridiana]
MIKCPYCFEVLEEKIKKCPHCEQFIIDTIIETEFKSLDKKKCFFCGKKILKEAHICRHCKQWLDSVDNGASTYDQI